jgi:hypothetical protein
MLSHRILSTSNLLKHYHSWHKGIATSHNEAKRLTINPTEPDFFRKYDTGLSYNKARKMAPDLIVLKQLKVKPCGESLVPSFCCRTQPVRLNIYIAISLLNSL